MSAHVLLYSGPSGFPVAVQASCLAQRLAQNCLYPPHTHTRLLSDPSFRDAALSLCRSHTGLLADPCTSHRLLPQDLCPRCSVPPSGMLFCRSPRASFSPPRVFTPKFLLSKPSRRHLLILCHHRLTDPIPRSCFFPSSHFTQCSMLIVYLVYLLCLLPSPDALAVQGGVAVQ